jgi:7,8-dihydropterin-6-yl-methyl-4-(beta-D-ribofuranosyl)aminobenzene 5'-phosphate synthase
MPNINRRDALKMSAGLAVAAGGFSCIEMAKAGPIDVPTIDKLSVRVLVDSASDIFFRPQEVAGVKTEPGRSANSLRPLHSEWGLSLLLEPQRGDDKRTFLLDYGWTPETINGNMELLKVDASKIDTLIMSHGHFDHWGGLLGFLDKHRKDLPADITMYAGGEDNFCQRYARGGSGELSDYGMLDRRDIARQNVKLVLCEQPVVIGGPSLHHRQDQAQQHRESAPELDGGVQAQGRRRLQCQPLSAGRNGRQDRARRAYP